MYSTFFSPNDRSWKQVGSKSAYTKTLNGITFFRSYDTIIAAYEQSTKTAFVTNQRYSVTTSKHMSTVVWHTIIRDFGGQDAKVETASPATLEEMHYRGNTDAAKPKEAVAA